MRVGCQVDASCVIRMRPLQRRSMRQAPRGLHLRLLTERQGFCKARARSLPCLARRRHTYLQPRADVRRDVLLVHPAHHRVPLAFAHVDKHVGVGVAGQTEVAEACTQSSGSGSRESAINEECKQ